MSKNLIGDGLYIGPALVRWHEDHPDYDIDLLTNNDHVACIYSRMGLPLRVIFDDDQVGYDFRFTFDCSAAFDVCSRKGIHIVEGYAELLGVTLNGVDNSRLKPIFQPTIEWIEDSDKDLVLVSMFSMSCTSRDKRNPGLPPNKMLPWHKWEEILKFLRKHFGDEKLRFIGAPTDRAPELSISEDQYLTGIPLNRLALLMRSSRCVITLDNGMSHLAASQEAREIVFYPACLGIHYIAPLGNPRCAVLHMDPVTVTGTSLVAALKVFVSTFQI